MFGHVQAVVFDAVGTLIKPRQPVAKTYRAVGLRHGFDISRTTIERRFREAFAAEEARDARTDGWRTSESRERLRWRTIVGKVFVTEPRAGQAAQQRDTSRPASRTSPATALDADSSFERLFEDLWNHFAAAENWMLYPEVPHAWRAIAASGRALAVASNLDERLPVIGAGLPPLGACQHWFVSSQIGVRKPGGAFFAEVQRRLAVPSEKLLLVGDDYDNDFRGAVASGWHAVLLDRDGTGGHAGAIPRLDALLALLD